MNEEIVHSAEETIYGYRAWFISDDGLLQSIVASTIWPPRLPTTGEVGSCFMCGHDKHLGVHAHTQPEFTYREYIYYRGPNGPKVVMGMVALGGKVIEHERGYRAGQGYPSVLYICPPGLNSGYASADQVRELANAYGVDVAPLPQACLDTHTQLALELKQHIPRPRPKWYDSTHWGVPGARMLWLCEQLESAGGDLPQVVLQDLLRMDSNYDSLGSWLIIKRCLDRRLMYRLGKRGQYVIHLENRWRDIAATLAEVAQQRRKKGGKK